MKEGYILAHDIGTSGDKAILCDTDGNVVSSAIESYEIIEQHPGWREMNPGLWWAAVTKATRTLLSRSRIRANEVEAIGLSGIMLGCTPIDKRGKPLTASIIWSDLRSARQADRIKKKITDQQMFNIAGMRNDPTFSVSKMLWLKENRPNIFEKTYKFVQCKDYIAFKLTGTIGTDYSDAFGTSLLDVYKREWSDKLMAELNIPSDKLPQIHSSTEIIGEVTSYAARQTGLRKGIPVVAGAGDLCSGPVGAAVVDPGDGYINVGTSAQILAISEKPVRDREIRVKNIPHMISGRYMVGGGTLSSGHSYRWIRDEICSLEKGLSRQLGIDAYQILDNEAREVNPGADGLIFLPYILGERFPVWNMKARGVIFGLALSHKREHIIRAVLEGVSYSFRNAIETIEKQGVKINSIKLTGGGSKSTLWREIISNVLGKTIFLPGTMENASSFGAAIAAMVGIGILDRIEEAKRVVKIIDEVCPKKKHHQTYNSLFKIYTSLYENIKESYEELHEFTQI